MPRGILSDKDRARLGDNGLVMVGCSSCGCGKDRFSETRLGRGEAVDMFLTRLSWLTRLLMTLEGGVGSGVEVGDGPASAVTAAAAPNSTALVFSNASASKGRKFK